MTRSWTKSRLSPNLGPMRLIWVLSWIGIVLASQTSCSFKSAIQPSVLVIMVESLGFGSFACDGSTAVDHESGLQTFCDESVRFTHAYTTSLMSQAAVASILTAQFPYQHGVRHNGFHFLSAKTKTVSEEALSRNYRTSFFSGGPPIWRKSGFNQGIEVFDDHIHPSFDRLYRPAHEVSDIFLSWQENEAPRGRFLSFLYFADLQFIDVPTTNELGEMRDSSYRSQLAEVSESLDNLIKELKRRKVWDSTDVILVGLNGSIPDSRDDEVPSTNLFSERTRVALMIKPARKRRDGPFNWKIDSNVSLADVGATLFDIVGYPKTRSMSFPEVVSLRTALKGPEPDWPEERLMLSESAWSSWRGYGGIRAAVRKGSFLHINDTRPLLFDTLTDSLEISPLPLSDRRYDVLRSELSGFLEQASFEAWKPLDHLVADKMELARELWRSRSPSVEMREGLKSLSSRYPKDEQLLGWRAIWALRTDNWAELKAAAGKSDLRPLWWYVAARNSGEKTELPNDPCLGFLKANGKSWQVPRDCTSEGFAELMRWRDESLESSERTSAMEAFFKIYGVQALSVKIAEQNHVNGLAWDTSLAFLEAPSFVDLVLALPEMKKYRVATLKRIAARRVAPTE